MKTESYISTVHTPFGRFHMAVEAEPGKVAATFEAEVAKQFSGLAAWVGWKIDEPRRCSRHLRRTMIPVNVVDQPPTAWVRPVLTAENAKQWDTLRSACSLMAEDFPSWTVSP